MVHTPFASGIYADIVILNCLAAIRARGASRTNRIASVTSLSALSLRMLPYILSRSLERIIRSDGPGKMFGFAERACVSSAVELATSAVQREGLRLQPISCEGSV